MQKYKKFDHIEDNFKNLQNKICNEFENLEKCLIGGQIKI